MKKSILDNPILDCILTVVIGVLLYVANIYSFYLGGTVVLFLITFFSKRNKPMYKALGKKAKGNNAKTIICGGLIIGLCGSLIPLLVALLSKKVTVSVTDYDVKGLLYTLYSCTVAWFFVCLLFNMFVYQRLRRAIPKKPFAAILITALVQTVCYLFLELPNISYIVFMFLISVMINFIVYFLDSFWTAVVAGIIWNLITALLFGVSHNSDYGMGYLFTLSGNNSFVFNAETGIDGSIFGMIVIVLIYVGIMYWGGKRRQKPLNVWESDY